MDEREFRALQAEIERLKARQAEVENRPAARLDRRLARLGASRRGRFALGAVVAMAAAVSYAATVSVPHTFTNGTVADAGQVNANFSALETESNAQDLRIAALEASMTAVQSQVAIHTTDIATNTTNIGLNGAGIATNAADIATNAQNGIVISVRHGCGLSFFSLVGFSSRRIGIEHDQF